MPESAQLSQLLDMERRLDMLLERKRIDIHDVFRKPPRVWRCEPRRDRRPHRL